MELTSQEPELMSGLVESVKQVSGLAECKNVVFKKMHIELVHAQLRREKGRPDLPHDLQLDSDLAAALKEKDPDPTILKRLSEKLQIRTINDFENESLACQDLIIASGGDPGDCLENMSSLLKKLKDFVLIENPVMDTSHGVELPNNEAACRSKKSGSSSVSDSDGAVIVALVEKLAHGNAEQQRAAACELRLLAKRNADNRVRIAETGAIPLLVELLSSTDSQTQEHAVTGLLNLSIAESNKGTIVNAGAIPYIVDVLKNGSMEARENAAATLFSLSIIDENKVTIGAAGALPALIKLLCDGTPRGKKDATTAIFNLSIYQGNKARAVRAGIVPPLMRLLKDAGGGGLADDALAILAILASHPEAKVAISQSEPIPILTDVLKTGSPRNRENAAALLWSLCTGDLQPLKIAKDLDAEEAVKELSVSGTDRAKRYAAYILESLPRC